MANHPTSLQGVAGNLAVQRLLRSGAIQAKLTVNRPGDRYEEEADRVAEQVMRMPEPAVQRQCDCGGGAEECEACHRKRVSLQRQGAVSGAPAVAPAAVHETLASDPGRPLDAATRAFFEPRFGQDLKDVRVHVDAEAAEAVQARAFTVGRDVVFGAGAYAPGTEAGRRLLAHELVHTIQQRGPGGPGLALQRSCRANADESFYRSAPNYCRDTGFTGMMHSGQTCYREVPVRSGYWECPPADHVCFDAEGHCHDSSDRASMVESKNADGTCNIHWSCLLGAHSVEDVAPGLWEEATGPIRRELEKALDWRNWLPLMGY